MKRLIGKASALDHFRMKRREGSALDVRLPSRPAGTGLYAGSLTPLETASRIIAEVRADGDKALFRISKVLDGVPLKFIEVPPGQIRRGAALLPSPARAALEFAAGRVRKFQESARPETWRDETGQLGETVTPMARVGLYVPGGTAPLASTVLMTAVPAKVAGVGEIVLCTPAPGDSLPHPAVLAAAEIAGVDRVYKVGGAQAIAAMSYGTETVPKVDLVCGPGNIFVTAAKKLVYGDVGIDGLYGPTETLVLADDAADAEFCAVDLLAQAEHDVMAMPVLIVISENKADEVEAVLERRLASLSRRAIASEAMKANGVTVVVRSVEEGIEVANEIAPEHLCLAVTDAARYARLVRSAGGIFIGESSAEVMADYVAGPSHVMPTGGTARFSAALSVRNFVRITPFLALSEQAFMELAPYAAQMARLEGLGGHVEAAEVRQRRIVGE